jgi:hypothetical protein
MISKFDKIIPDFAIFVKSFLEGITNWNQAIFLIRLRPQRPISGGNKEEIGGSTHFSLQQFHIQNNLSIK